MFKKKDLITLVFCIGIILSLFFYPPAIIFIILAAIVLFIINMNVPSLAPNNSKKGEKCNIKENKVKQIVAEEKKKIQKNTVAMNLDDTSYCSIDGNLYSKDKTRLIKYVIGKSDETFMIPNTVTSIGNCAFEHCTSLTSVTIPDSVISIGEKAFRWCDKLREVYIIGNNLKNIGRNFEIFSLEHALVLWLRIDYENSKYEIRHIGGYSLYGTEGASQPLVLNKGDFSKKDIIENIINSNILYDKIDENILKNNPELKLIMAFDRIWSQRDTSK